VVVTPASALVRRRRVADVTKPGWDKAKPKPAPELRDNRRTAMLRQTAMVAYVDQHELACFKCVTRKAEWAKTGRSRRGRWAICVDCVHG
jgi:hypothetical protein